MKKDNTRYRRFVRRRTAGLVVAAVCALSAVHAQEPGVLKGRVTDIGTDQPVIGANVGLTGTEFRGVTDINGNYSINNVAAGAYELYAKTVGYVPFMKPGVIVDPGQAVTVDVALEAEGVAELEKIVVTATAISAGEGALLRERQSAIEFTDAIGAQAMSRSGAGNAADAAKRMPGATIVGGKYIYIRGLGDRYTSTRLNGALLPSPDPDKRSVPMDLFPASLLENIKIYKTYLPDKPGNFAGGMVEVNTKGFPEKFLLEASSSIGYVPGTSLSDGFLDYKGGDLDWWGMDDGTRDIPDELYLGDTISIPDYAASPRDSLEIRRLDSVSNAFNSVMEPEEKVTPLNQSHRFTVGNTFDILGRPLGILGSFTYKSSYSKNENAEYGREGETLELQDYFADSKSTSDVLWSLLLNGAFEPWEGHRVEARYVRVQNGEDEARILDGRDEYISETFDITDRALHYRERYNKILQVNGEHLFAWFGDTKLDWRYSHVNSGQNEPDFRTFLTLSLIDTTETTDSLGRTVTEYDTSYRSHYNELPTRTWRRLTESADDVSVNMTVPFYQWGGDYAEAKAGYSYYRKERDFEQEQFQYKILKVQYYNGDTEEFFTDRQGIKEFNGYYYDWWSYLMYSTSPLYNYHGYEQYEGAYAMLDLPLVDELKFIGGMRYEETAMHFASDDTVAAKGRGKLTEFDLLPVCSFAYGLGENMNLRFAYTRTLARPTLRELAPFQSSDYVSGAKMVGNNGLKQTTIDNGDFRWEWFMAAGEVAAVSLFLKKLYNPIERQYLSENDVVQPVNTRATSIYGIEFEYGKRLGWLAGKTGGGFLADVTVGGNLTLSHSAVEIGPAAMVSWRAVFDDPPETRPLEGQSPYVVNLNLQYDHEAWGLKAGFYYHRFGKRLDVVGAAPTPDVYEMPRDILDFTSSYDLPYGMKLKFSVKNILCADKRFEYYYAADGKELSELQSVEAGDATINLGLSYAFE